MSANNIGSPSSRDMTQRAFDIERRSYEIIDLEAGSHQYQQLEWDIVKRVIHSTADFDFCGSARIVFHPQAIESAFQAFRRRGKIVTDVDMLLSALSKKSLNDLGLSARCYISEPQVLALSQQKGLTRSEAAMRMAAGELNGGIVAIGNAPTALFEVVNLIENAIVKPALVIGLPVGFVSAAESKELLKKLNVTDVPYITNTGRKGGSPACAAVVNALMLLYKNRENHLRE